MQERLTAWTQRQHGPVRQRKDRHMAEDRAPIRWWLAALLMLITPLAGALYVGRRWVIACTLVLTLVLVGLLLLPGFQPDATAAALIGILAVAVAALAVLVATLVEVWRNPTAPAAPWRRWYVLVLVAVLGFGVTQIDGAGRLQAFSIPSESMLPTLQPGDRLMAVMAPARAEALPARGDLLLYTPRPGQPIYIHRLIALPGERVQMRDGIPHINGAALPREAIGSPGDRHFGEILPGGRRITIMETDLSGPYDNTAEVTVPSGSVFLLGDNRDNAVDSRLHGPVPIASLHGVAQLLYWSGALERIGTRLR